MNRNKNDDNEGLQQQVIFSENNTVVEKPATQFKEDATNADLTAQVVFDNDDYFPLAVDESDLEIEKVLEVTPVQAGKHSWLWTVITVSFISLLTIEAVNFFITGFGQSPIITSIYALLLASITLVAGSSLWREWVGLKQFKQRHTMQNQATAILDISPHTKTETNNKRGKAFCENISECLPCDLVFDNTKEQQVWQDAVSSDYPSAELVQLYSRVVLSKVDEKALNEVAKFSTEAVVLIALSPVALIDMFIMLSRNLRMINKIAGLYGLKLGYWSRIKLIKQVFVNMAYAGASELIADFGSEMLGAELLGKLSARFGQGLGAGLLTARLGAKTMELCRPIPFKEKPKLTDVRKKIAVQIKSLLNLSKK